jgi:predicted amidophosphoribosyltransferase
MSTLSSEKRCPTCGAELQRFTSRLHCPACNKDVTLTSKKCSDVIERLQFVKSQDGYGELADDCIREIQRLRTQIEILQRANRFLSEQIPTAPETASTLTPIEQLLTEWWSTDMDNAELFNRAVRLSPALADAMQRLPQKAAGQQFLTFSKRSVDETDIALALEQAQELENDGLSTAARCIRACANAAQATLETAASSPFDHAAILGAPRERRISMSFETQEQYEAALVFLDMADVKNEGGAG